MEFYSINIPAKQFTLYPLGDWHYGSRQCDIKFIQRVVDEVRDNPDARWIGLGDFIENAIVGSKSDVYLQTLPPKEQIEAICDILAPIKDKGLFLVGGNHEARTMRVVGQQPEMFISYKLNIPYAGYSCMAVVDLEEAKTPRSFSIYAHHNWGGGWTSGGKVTRAEKLSAIVPTVDATFSGHFHITSRTARTWFEPGYGQVIRKTGYDYIIGSALRWDQSYAEERAKPAATVEHIKVTFIGNNRGDAVNRQQIYEVITA
jgi:hypothetical protein